MKLTGARKECIVGAMDETTKPALTPEQWANWKDPDGLPFVFNYGNPQVYIAEAPGEGSYATPVMVQVMPEGIRPLIALLLKAWERGSGPPLWTWEDVRVIRDLVIAVQEYSGGHYHVEEDIATALADRLAALLPPEGT